MAEPVVKPPIARAVFSDAARACLVNDEPIRAHDSDTGIELIYRPDDATLTLYAGTLGDRTIQAQCPEADINAVAARLLQAISPRR